MTRMSVTKLSSSPLVAATYNGWPPRSDVEPHRGQEVGWLCAWVRLSVELVVLSVRDEALRALLVEHETPPRPDGATLLPASIVHFGESLNGAAERALREHAGVDPTRLALPLTQFRTHAPLDDPRGRVASTAFFAVAPDLPTPIADTDAPHAHWVTPEDSMVQTLAVDQRALLTGGVQRLRSLLEHTTIAAALCGATFTIADLQRVYETVWNVTLDASNFGRAAARRPGFIVPVGQNRKAANGRPAALYQRGTAEALEPPMRRTAGNQRSTLADAHHPPEHQRTQHGPPTQHHHGPLTTDFGPSQ
jgi:8-oxo-dGTP diphosphatase